MAFLPLSLPDFDALLPASIRDAVEASIGRIHAAALNDEGTSVRAVRLNTGWVLRWARAASVNLGREADLLAAVGAALPARWRPLIPHPEARGTDWLLHPLLPGIPTTRRRLMALPMDRRERFQAEFGAFLQALHRLSPISAIAPAATPQTAKEWQRLAAAAEADLFPLMSATLADDQRAALAAMAAEPPADATALIHDDLHPSHILHDPATGQFTGLLDFGRAGRGNATVDLAGLLYNWGAGLVAALAYPGIEDRLAAAARLARTYEAQWALEGLKRKDPRWFLFALGAAKNF